MYVCVRRNHRGPTRRYYCMADDRAARHDGDPSVSAIRSADVPRVHVLADDVSGLQHVPDSDVHPVRV